MAPLAPPRNAPYKAASPTGWFVKPASAACMAAPTGVPMSAPAPAPPRPPPSRPLSVPVNRLADLIPRSVASFSSRELELRLEDLDMAAPPVPLEPEDDVGVFPNPFCGVLDV